MAEGDEHQISEEELRKALEQIKVADVVVQTISTLSSLTLHRLEAKELEQARLGIEAVRALIPIVEGHVPAELHGQLEDLLAQLQLAYANAVAG